jgi:hypothetical protein
MYNRWNSCRPLKDRKQIKFKFNYQFLMNRMLNSSEINKIKKDTGICPLESYSSTNV